MTGLEPPSRAKASLLMPSGRFIFSGLALPSCLSLSSAAAALGMPRMSLTSVVCVGGEGVLRCDTARTFVMCAAVERGGMWCVCGFKEVGGALRPVHRHSPAMFAVVVASCAAAQRRNPHRL